MPDLTTLFATYLVTLRTATPGGDMNTLIVNHRPTVKAAVELVEPEVDENTMYSRYLAP